VLLFTPSPLQYRRPNNKNNKNGTSIYDNTLLLISVIYLSRITRTRWEQNLIKRGINKKHKKKRHFFCFYHQKCVCFLFLLITKEITQPANFSKTKDAV